MEASDLTASQGQTVSFGLYNCVDPYAKCQVKVGRVRRIKLKRERSRIRTLSGATSVRLDSKEKDLTSGSHIFRQNKDSQRVIP